MKQHLIQKEKTLREALAALNSLSGGNLTLFIADGDILLGSLTDGDVRRALTSGASLDSMAVDWCNRNCIRIKSDTDRYLTGVEALRRGISLIPVVRNNRIIALEDLRGRHALLPLDAVLMAGGKGERLRPLTLDTPKPLLPVGGKPIIDHNVESLASYGVQNFFVTVNYLKHKIIDHFKNHFALSPALKDNRIKIECIEEPCRLGTMGSLSLIEDLTQQDLIVMNSDLLTTIDYEKMFLCHKESGADLTIAVVSYSIRVPYAVIEQKGDRVMGLSEKPTFTYLSNAGIYMMKRDVALQIEHGKYLDATDLIESLIARGMKVVSFPIDGTWIDIGNPDDYNTANNIAGKSRTLSKI